MSSHAVTSERGTTGLANEAWESLLEAHTTIMKRFVAEDIWDELSMREYDVLYTLSKCSEPIHLGELQEQVLLSQPALSRMVDRLVTRGLIRRETDPSDGRGVLLSLTPDGIEAQRRVGRRHARSVAVAMNSALTPSQLDRLTHLCQTLAQQCRTRDDKERK